jgi:hypothetical protein
MAGMKHLLHHFVLLIATLLFSQGCVEELFERSGSDEEGTVDIAINFGSSAGTSVDVSTKSALGIVRESNVFNMYLLIFDSSTGKKIYGHYFDGTNLGTNSKSNWWEVTNMISDSNDPTHGTLHINTAKKASCTVVAVANMNPNDLDVSAGKLSTIKTYSQLQDVVATQVRSEIAANTGFFLMTGQVDGVRIMGDSDPNDITQKTYTLSLQRIYAKVSFNVRIAKNAPIRSFTPYKWQVVNVPSCSYLLEKTSPNVDAATSDSQFFSTDALGFEKETLTDDDNDFYAGGSTKVSIHSFSFYMMENRKAPLLAFPQNKYAYREMRAKNDVEDHGSYYTCTNGDFIYADPHSTYVVITGKIVMGTSVTVGEGSNAQTNDNATLDADVTYVIHLGDFQTNVQDFNTKRNYNYIYNIFINGAEDIKAEVEANNGSASSLDEPEPGASGRVVVAMEEIFDSDCHYSTQVISFHAAYMDPNKISWYVESPFNPDGIGPPPRQEIDMTKVDYKWVEFRVNEKGPDGLYSNNRVEYKPHDWSGFAQIPAGDKRRTMYIDELVMYLAKEKEQYLVNAAESDFDNDNQGGGPKISVTAFVDEYYYTLHPLSGQYDPTLWKTIVNGPMRRMHILASSESSADGDSDMIGSSFTIQQRAIQSIYAIQESADLTSAWGMEFIDDMQEETGEKTYWKNKNLEDCGNTSPTNGRLNSMKLWGVLNPDGSNSETRPRWSDYLDLTSANETPQLLSDYKYLRYSCLSRNRDNNGDGYIDPEEIRWYMASDIQLIGVFMGSYGIEGDARLYQRSAVDQAESDKDKWRQHIIASNRYVFPSNPPADYNNSNKYPRIVWAEEGVNGSNMNYSGSDQTSNFSTRCVRNLGYYMEGGERKDITLTEDPEVEPDNYVTVTRNHIDNGVITESYTGQYDGNTFYEFDCSRINLASLREPVDHELIGHDEHSKMACLSSKYATAPFADLIDLSNKGSYIFNGKQYDLKSCKGLNEYLDASFPNLDSNFSVCPEGYRLPNVRELSLMWTMLTAMTTGDSAYLGSPNDDSDGTFSRTHWSFGVAGSGKAPTYWGWGMSGKHLLMSLTQKFSKPRCVKDL